MNIKKILFILLVIQYSLSASAAPVIEPIDVAVIPINVTVNPIDVTVSPIDSVVNPINVMIEPITAPSRPQELISNTNNSLTYRWKEVAGATDYYLWIIDSSGFQFKTWYNVLEQQLCSDNICSVTIDIPLEKGEGSWCVQSKSEFAYSSWSVIQPFNISDVLLGDANGDGKVNIQDVVSIINMVLSSTGTTLSADVNGDEQVNIQDIIATINLVLNAGA